MPGPAIENCVDLLALQAREAGIELRLRLAQNLPEIAADKRAFSQILINLISNAVKFTPRARMRHHWRVMRRIKFGGDG